MFRSGALLTVRRFSTRLRDRPAAITVTQRAADRVKELLQNQDGDALGVRLSVKRRGCNGYSYTMNYTKPGDLNIAKDEKIETHGITIFVDPKAIFFLVGTQMDYEETELSSEFKFTNPNSKGECGCGESFNV